MVQGIGLNRNTQNRVEQRNGYRSAKGKKQKAETSQCDGFLPTSPQGHDVMEGEAQALDQAKQPCEDTVKLEAQSRKQKDGLERQRQSKRSSVPVGKKQR